jgi:predicted SAM-dependent methyltransferase
LGAGGVADPGWIPTDHGVLDITRAHDWAKLFSPDSIDALLAEHVWEHLNLQVGQRAAKLCYRYLRPGGYLRLAVPDGLHPDPAYRDLVRPGGSGAGADTHRIFYDYRSLSDLLKGAGFTVELIEYFDSESRFMRSRLDPRRGVIWRSFDFDRRNTDGQPHYTSLIVDAAKPAY